MFKGRKNKGLTLIELLIVMAIGFILVTVALPIYPNINISAHLNDYSERLIQDLRIAQGRSLNGLNNNNHGIYIIPEAEGSGYVLYEGDSYLLRDSTYDRVVDFEDIVSATSTYGSDINFSLLSGYPNSTGTITINHQVEGSRVIFVNEVGIVSEINEFN